MMNLTKYMWVQRWASLSLSIVFLFFMSCEDAETPTINFEEEETAAFEAEESVENFFDAIESITTSAIKHTDPNSGGRTTEGTSDPELIGAEITVTTQRVEINFGEGVEGPDGRIRKGIIEVLFDGNWIMSGSKIWTVLNDFYIDDVKIEGTRILKNISQGETLMYTVVLEEGKVIWPDETFLTRSGMRTHTLILNNGLADFELHVDGNFNGLTRLGLEYSAEISEPLIFKSTCRGSAYFPVSGIKTISIPEKPEITVNYGGGDCDKTFRITIGEGSKEVTL